MGWTSERVADYYKVSRERQDEAAFRSHSRASEVSLALWFDGTCSDNFQALSKGIFADEILPIEVRGKVVSVDDTIRPGVTLEKLATLKPAFPQWEPSTTTAGNASGIGDGAGICILTTRVNAEKQGMPILGKWVGSTVVGVAPRYMGISPAVAIPKLLSQLGLAKEDVDVYEVGIIPVSWVSTNCEARSMRHSRRSSCTVWTSCRFLSRRSTRMVAPLPFRIPLE